MRGLSLSKMPFLTIYGLAHFGKSLFWHSSNLVFAFFLTELVGLSPAPMGLLLALSLILNAFADLGLGWGLRHRVRCLASATRLQLLGSLVCGIVLPVFALSPSLPLELRFPHVLMTFCFFSIGYSVLDVPQNAIMALVTSDDDSRTKVAGVRYVGSGLAIVVVAMLVGPWAAAISQGRRLDDFLWFSLGLALMVLAVSLLLHLAGRSKTAIGSAGRQIPELAEPVSPRLWGYVLGSILVVSGLLSVFGKLEAYFIAYVAPVVGLGTAAMYLMLAVGVGQAASQFIWSRLVAALGLPSVYRLATLVLMAASLLFPLAIAGGKAAFMLCALTFGASSGGLLMVLWALLAKVAAGNPQGNLHYFGRFTFASKMAQAISALALGGILSLFDYRAAESSGILTALMAGAPLMAGVICLILAITLSARTGLSAKPVWSAV